MTASISDTLRLPCGAVLPNRICKAAMTEGLADPRNHATARHETLYRRWSEGGAGLLLTGNVQVDRRYLERPGNVAIERELADEGRAGLKAFAQAATANGNHVWMQLSHAGRQTPRRVTKVPVAPSAVRLKLPKSEFGDPRALEVHEIKDVIGRFAFAAGEAKRTGFTGVQIHSAHGYLLSEFLSPRVNQRTDEWGGSLENRARLLLEVIAAVRGDVGPDFPIAVKLNSSDFQKGGFTNEECLQVVDWLNATSLDLLEISGGSYEQPKLMDTAGVEPVYDEPVRESTRAREAYFMDYAVRIRQVARMPLMVTGGFRTVQGMNEALGAGELDMVGIGRPLCVEPDLPRRMLSGETAQAPLWEKRLRVGPGIFGPNSPILLMKLLNGFGVQGWFCLQLLRMADGLDPDTEMSVFKAYRLYQKNENDTAKALAAVGGRAL